MLQTNCEEFKMRNIIKNKIKDRLKYCVEWEKRLILFCKSGNLKKANDK